MSETPKSLDFQMEKRKQKQMAGAEALQSRRTVDDQDIVIVMRVSWMKVPGWLKGADDKGSM
jgi:hypothetical protein